MDMLHSKAVEKHNLLQALKVGDRLQLCSPFDDDEHRYPVTVIGWIPDKSIVLEPPRGLNWQLLFNRKQRYTIRLFSGTSAFAFVAQILCILDKPYDHIHVSYPTEVYAAPVRRAERALVDLAAEVRVENNERPVKANMVDASVLGARIRATSDLGDVGDSIKVSLHLKTGGKEWPVSLSCIIRNKHLATNTNGDSSPTYYGLEFDSVDDNQALIITSFLYEQKHIKSDMFNSQN